MKSILILGATSDIALNVAEIFASKDYKIILAGRSNDDLERIQKDLAIRFESNIQIAEFDVRDFTSHLAFVNELSTLPDIVLSCIGYLGHQEKAENDWQETSAILETNYSGIVSIFNLFAYKMEKRGSGVMVGVSSVAGDRGRKSNYIYGSAKAGFSSYLSGLRNRLYSKGIHVLTVKPGYVYTKMTEGLDLPTLLTSQPKDIAKAIHSAIIGRKNVLYYAPIWRVIMLIIRVIPENIFKRLSL